MPLTAVCQDRHNFLTAAREPLDNEKMRNAARGRRLRLEPGTVARVQSFEVAEAAARLRDRGGGFDVVHTSPGLEVGVYVLVAPEEDKQVPHVLDEIYVVLDGDGEIEVEGERRPIRRGDAVFVPAGAEHNLHPYEDLTLLVVFNGPHSATISTL